MFFVVKTGGKQYLLSDNQDIVVEKIDSEVGKNISLDEVLAFFDDKKLTLGTPVIDGAKVKAKILAQDKSPKKFTIKYQAKKRFRLKQGKRQPLTKLLIERIEIKESAEKETNESVK